MSKPEVPQNLIGSIEIFDKARTVVQAAKPFTVEVRRVGVGLLEYILEKVKKVGYNRITLLTRTKGSEKFKIGKGRSRCPTCHNRRNECQCFSYRPFSVIKPLKPNLGLTIN